MGTLTQEQMQQIEAQYAPTEKQAEAAIKTVGKDADPSNIRQTALWASTDELRSLLMKRAEELVEMNEKQGFSDPTRLDGGVDLSDEEFQTLLKQAVSKGIDGFGNLPDLSKGALKINTYRFTTLVQGVKSGITDMELVKESSQPRYCLAGYYQQVTGRDMRAQRLEVILPPRELTPDVVEQLEDEKTRKLAQTIPQPRKANGDIDRAKARRLAARDSNDLQKWQINKIERAVITHCKETNRIQVFTDPETRADTPGFTTYTVLLMDEAEVKRFSGDVGRVHYLNGLVSGNGTVGGSNDPDYRKINYLALTAEEASPIAELLGTGPYEAGEMGDGRGMILLPKWPTDSEGNPMHHWALEVQNRMVFGWEQEAAAEELKESEDHFLLGFSKGMHRPYHPQALKEAVGSFNRMPADEQQRYKQAHQIIRAVQQNGMPLAIVIRGDQMKIGGLRDENGAEPERMTVPDYGVALMGCTYLKGTHETETVERIDYDEESETYGEVLEVDVPKPQYEISMNSQITQFLSPTGFKRLEEHLEIEAGLIANSCKSLPGIARLASENTLGRLHNMQKLMNGEPGDIQPAKGQPYRANGDALTDAILGGGVRQKAKEQIKTMMGEQGIMQMLPSTRRRFDRVLAAHVRSYLYNGLGGYGFGFHHATVANSTSLLWRMWNNYEVDRITPASTYLKGSAQGYAEIKNPIADRSATVMPHKVTGLMNADDDGDITISMAAVMEVQTPDGPQVMTVILTWRYPCVDVPVLWAMPKDAPCPFLGRNQEERERFERIIRMFGPELQETETTPDGDTIPTCGVEEDGITRLEATEAYRLADKGAKSGKKTRRQGALTQTSAHKLIAAKRSLNSAGLLTRDLERLGDMMATCIQLAEQAEENGYTTRAKQLRGEFNVLHKRAVGCAQNIEKNLTAFKYKMQGRIKSPDLTSGVLDGYTDPKVIRQQVLPLSYHEDYERVVSIDEGHRRVNSNTDPRETSFELYEGPTCSSRHGQMLRRVTKTTIPQIVEALQNIETDVQPFRMAISRRMKRWQKDVVEELGYDKAVERFKETKAESDRTLQYCEFYRAFWRTLLEETQEVVDHAHNQEKAQEWRETRIRLAGRHIHLVMQAISQSISAPGLAHGVRRDWEPWVSKNGEEYANSPAAGMALITGRMGEVFIPQNFMVGAPLAETRTKHTVVWRKGETLPVAEMGIRRKVLKAGIDPDKRVIALKLAQDEEHDQIDECLVNVDKDQHLPEGFPEEVTVYLSRVADQQGVLFWRHE